MPRKRPSEKPKTLDFGPFGPRNLKEVYQFVDFSPSVSAELRDEGLGALLMLARLHAAFGGEPLLDVLARIPANVPLLRSYLKKAHAKRQEYSDGTWRNMRMHVFSCLRAAGVKVRKGRNRVPLPEPFQAFFERLDEDGQKVLYPFLRWVVEEGLLSLSQITQAVLDRYEAYLDDFDGRERRRAAYTAVVLAWGKARAALPDLKLSEVSIISKRERYVLDWSALPVHAEVERMMDAAMHPDPAFPRRRKRINAATAEHQTKQLRRMISALVHATGFEPSKIISLRLLVEPNAARAALRFLASRAYQRQLARDRGSNPK